MDTDLLSARETCRLLGISQATLYAYVSRGLLESRPGPDHRSRLYPRQDVERLAQRKRAGRGAARGAAQSLDRGLPVLETQISLIRPDGPYYRGRSAVEAVRTGATLEDIARLLWDCGEHDPFAVEVDGNWPATVATIAGNERLPPLARAMAAIPLLALDVQHSFNSAPRVRHEIAAALLRHNAALLVAQPPFAGPVHRLLAQCWKPDDEGFAELVRAALVVCADHELNVSAFAARVVASTGAHLHATVCSGLAALSGPRHGGATARAYALIADAREAGSARDFIAMRWQRGDDLPGFGHAMYPHGDPRAAELLPRLRELHAGSPMLESLETIIAATEDISGQRPNIDFMLAAICHANGLAATPALVMFAAGRLAGWLAHALEQQAQGRLIRPRARYAGVAPAEPA
ncbi:citrate synthase family protein [Pseudoxanthomonas wuyuanensis]|uniref:citrate synthase (unknown stereospecificity) n=1 Tax=Pseudoxanthomonas wuyuanensis TaxID=1073196 RepID=A0A286D7G8_9GAMM|nr:citrate synthase family protein [Pseudoxanthomonas wuyuanensis]KAF1719038.1 citrate synthase [Pseudoxanthomonas wuyuanensis]SOD54588.1 citrate synthase [Pseudoxanthomonas wuyuanensis]